MAKRIIISGGGTGGHIFPAIAIANALKRIDPSTEILFVGALGRMEMERIPAAGYTIVGLDIRGFQRKSLLKNLALPFQVISSLMKARSVIRDFKPDAAVGVGGYASGPLLYMAGMMKVPYLIQEQNSYAGITNKWLGKNAKKICVAFSGMSQFFPADKIMITGNPIRKEAVDIAGKREEGLRSFGLSLDKKTILVTGGSLGARTLNECMLKGIDQFIQEDVQLIWQTGKYYYTSILASVGDKLPVNVCIVEFLDRMDLAYAAADVIISRAGAGTIVELYVVKKPVILVPSPNVAEDHQTKNALALTIKNAAIMITDSKASEELINAAISLVKNEQICMEMSKKIGGMALPDADEQIAKEVLLIAG
ncbi:undecaprenyldiphospho-muramoylpentapeptide beta-N-acetylglucosaminyltransferase [Arcticibacter eurypsychrophilus]|uniref:undecaprenyldiphospho-muramoylpentapeptide beta-N-acetylglucosaminyltransferase n=1 Tax=Arcticibacter eurypsychrophilus TaxID=1434752 RepID=UPI00084DDDA2|nr:undecaprenyldiphospho-muramoylpentapeptide beta-N-acetylglucosaminyltransferase [Arcticibacter eurypsychrophilus]